MADLCNNACPQYNWETAPYCTLDPKGFIDLLRSNLMYYDEVTTFRPTEISLPDAVSSLDAALRVCHDIIKPKLDEPGVHNCVYYIKTSPTNPLPLFLVAMSLLVRFGVMGYWGSFCILLDAHHMGVPGTHYKLTKLLHELINNSQNPYLNLTTIMHVFHKVYEGMELRVSDSEDTDTDE